MADQAEPATAPVAVTETPDARTTSPPTTEGTSTAPSTTEDTATAPPLSKNQQKKLAKQKRFEETRPAWKAARREKEKARKARKREENALKRKAEDEAAAADEGVEVTKRVKVAPPRVLEDITLLIDCGFDALMTEREVVSMSSQLTRCYSANRNSTRQFKMHVSSLNARLLERYEGTLQHQHKKWKGMTFSHDPYPITDENRENLVYLTADSENTISELEQGKTYIIGGIVDRNRHKMLCFNKAKEQGIAHGKLPIGEYIKMASRQVLTTNQVVEIMCEWLKEKDWEKAFIKVIPQRKMPALRKAGEGEGKEDEEYDEEEYAEEGQEEEIVAEETKPEVQHEQPEKMEVDSVENKKEQEEKTEAPPP